MCCSDHVILFHYLRATVTWRCISVQKQGTSDLPTIEIPTAGDVQCSGQWMFTQDSRHAKNIYYSTPNTQAHLHQ